MELTNASGHKEFKPFDNKKDAETFGQNTTKGVNAWYIIWSRKDLQPLENCLQIVKSCLENTLDEIRSHFSVEQVDYSIWLSGPKNFRDKIATTRPYKGNRAETPKPHYYKDTGEYLLEHWGAILTEGIEADDAIGIAAMEARAASHGYVLVTNDKDLRQIPGHHYNWVTKEFTSVSAKDAKSQLFAQILSGDPTDNIPGLEGIGPATAAKILDGAQSPEEMVDRVVMEYAEKAPGSDFMPYLKEQWALVYILRSQPTNSFRPETAWMRTKEGEYFIGKYGQA